MLKRTICAALCMCAPTLYAGDLTVTVDAIQSRQGNVVISLYNESVAFGSFSNELAVAGALLRPSTREASVTFHNLPEGEYAIAVLHDVNLNNKLDTDKDGLPTEGFGFSEGAGITKIPSFSEASFTLGKEAHKANLELVYMNE